MEALEIELKLGGARLGEENEKALQQVRAKEAVIKTLQDKINGLEKVAVSAGGGQSDLLKRIQEMEDEQREKQEKIGHLFFHNTCLLVKMMITKTEKPVSDVFIQDLYDEVRAQSIPMSDWPLYIYSSVGKPSEQQ